MTKNRPEISTQRLKRLLCSLIDIYSPSGKEQEISDYVERYLKGYGLPVKKQPVDDSRHNLVVFPEGEDEAEICFIGHLDTVTAHDLEDFGSSEEDGTIFGLGSTDMKAGCAAMLEAFTVLATGRRLPSVALALVVGEEEDNSGVKELVREYSFPWAIIGEPTDLAPCLGHYGYMEVLLHTEGKRVHSSMPELGLNAIESMLKLLLHITDYASSAPYGLVYNIRELSAFPGGFVVPDTCEAWLDLHLPPNSKVDLLRTELEQLVKNAVGSIPNLNVRLKFESTHPGYQISPERPLIGKLKKVFEELSLPWRPQDFRSHSDGNLLWAAGVDPIILGPGKLEQAHTPEESVPFEQVVQAARLYLHLALSLE